MASQTAQEENLSQVMTKSVKTMDASQTVGAAARIMVKQDVGSVVVVDGKKPIGIITERDITKQAVKADNVLKKKVKQVMSRSLVTASPSMPIQEAFELMVKNKIRRLPVLEDGNLVGIVTTKDLMRWVLRVSYEPNIPPHIKAILEAQ